MTIVTGPGSETLMSITESTCEAHTPSTLAKLRQPYVVALLLLVVIWIVVMMFRWQLRAQWWAHQAIAADNAEQLDFYVTRLASIRDRSLRAVPALLDDERPEIRSAGITILRYCQSEAAAELLLKMVADDNPDVAASAATTLAWRHGSTRYVPRLEQMLNGTQNAGWGAAVALGRINSPEAEQVLLKALATEVEPNVKAQLIDSLGIAGCEKAVPLMESALTDSRPIEITPHSQASAQRAIAALQGDLVAKGADPQQALKAVSTSRTVSAVAEYWLRLLGEKK